MAPPAYKEMLVAASADDVMLTRAFTGLQTSMLRPSIVAAGLDPDALPERGMIDVAKDINLEAQGERPRRWRDIWSAGHSTSGVREILSVEALVAETEREYLACADPRRDSAKGRRRVSAMEGAAQSAFVLAEGLSSSSPPGSTRWSMMKCNSAWIAGSSRSSPPMTKTELRSATSASTVSSAKSGMGIQARRLFQDFTEPVIGPATLGRTRWFESGLRLRAYYPSDVVAGLVRIVTALPTATMTISVAEC